MCVSGQWLCNDGMTCISEDLVCNGERDCYDGSDEYACGLSFTTLRQLSASDSMHIALEGIANALCSGHSRLCVCCVRVSVRR